MSSPTRTFGTGSLGGGGARAGSWRCSPLRTSARPAARSGWSSARAAGSGTTAGCELAEHRCVFLDEPLVALARTRRSRPPAPGRRCSTGRPAGPVVLADLSVTPFDPASVRRVVGVLGAGRRRAAGRRARQPARLPADDVRRRGARPPGGRLWTTLACRDRNRVVLEQELAGLAAVGVDGVLCVTGDGRGAERAARRHPGVRPRRHPAGRRSPRRPG